MATIAILLGHVGTVSGNEGPGELPEDLHRSHLDQPDASTALATAGTELPFGLFSPPPGPSLLATLDPVPVRPVATLPLPATDDPVVDVVPVPGSLVGGAAILGLLIASRCRRR